MVKSEVEFIPTYDIEKANRLWFKPINDSQNILANRKFLRIQDFKFDSLHFWVRYFLAFVVVDNDSRYCLDETKVSLRLHSQTDGFFNVKYDRSIPVLQ